MASPLQLSMASPLQFYDRALRGKKKVMNFGIYGLRVLYQAMTPHAGVQIGDAPALKRARELSQDDPFA